MSTFFSQAIRVLSLVRSKLLYVIIGCNYTFTSSQICVLSKIDTHTMINTNTNTHAKGN